MKYKVTVPFHWYAGEAHYRAPFLTCTFDNLEDARQLKRRLNKINSMQDSDLRDSQHKFVEMILDKYFNVWRDGFINGEATIHEVNLVEIN